MASRKLALQLIQNLHVVFALTECLICAWRPEIPDLTHPYLEFWGFPQCREEGWFLSLGIFFSRETFCTIFLGSKAVGEAAVLQVSKLRASCKLMRAGSTCALVWTTLLLTMKCPDLSFSISCECCSLEQMKEETVCKRANKDSTRREKMIWIKKDGHDKHMCIGYE